MRDEDHGDVEVAPVDSNADLVRYERGLPFRSVVRGTLLRFVPGAALAAGGGLALLGSGMSLFSPDGLLMLAGVLGLLALGFGAGLELLRRWLYPDAAVDGRRSFIAGLLSPLVAFTTGVLTAPAGPLPEEQALVFFFVLPGLVLALLMFAAWLSPTPVEE